mgnify:FL=1
MIYLLSTFFHVIVLAIYQAIRAVLVLISTPRVKPILTISFRNMEEACAVRDHLRKHSKLEEQYHLLGYNKQGETKIKVLNANLTHSDLEKVKGDILKALSK